MNKFNTVILIVLISGVSQLSFSQNINTIFTSYKGSTSYI